MDGTAEAVFENSTSGLLLAGPSGGLIRAEDYVDGGGVPVVMPKDLTSSGFSVASIRYITEQQAESLERFRINCGDVVLARRGELGRCAVVREEQQGWVCGTGCFVLRPPRRAQLQLFRGVPPQSGSTQVARGPLHGEYDHEDHLSQRIG
jgi:type I restriction enzyme M protein